MAKKNAELDFETALHTLEQLVTTMESGELSLEKSLEAFEQGIQLTKTCQLALQKAEQQVQILLSDNDDAVLQPFEASPSESQ